MAKFLGVFNRTSMLRDRYVVIEAGSEASAREIMSHGHGANWKDVYPYTSAVLDLFERRGFYEVRLGTLECEAS